MKFYLYVGLFLLLVVHWVSATQQINTDKALDRRLAMVKLIGNKLKTWWTKFVSENENQDTFTGTLKQLEE